MNDADTLVKLMLAHGADFDAIPVELVPTVRRLLFAAMDAARAEQAERDARLAETMPVFAGPRDVAAAIRAAAAASPNTPPAAE